MTTPIYQIIIKDLANNVVGVIDRFKNLSFQKVLNREGDFSFDMSLLDLKANPTYINHRQMQVFINRNDQVVFGGFMLQDQGKTNWTDDTFTVRGKGFFEIFQHRYTDPSNEVDYTDDAGNIAWDLINTSQGLTNGNVGITKGTIQASVSRTQAYTTQQVYQAIVDMGSDQIDQGFDFEITQTKVFNVYYPQMGSDKSGSISFVGGKNVYEVDFTHDHTTPVNEAIVQGQGASTSGNIVVVDDFDLQATYSLLQDVVSDTSVADTGLLTARGQLEIRKRAKPLIQYTISQTPGSDPDFTQLSVGDWVRVDIDRGYLSIHDVVRINSINVTYNDGIETPQYIFLYY